jgi:cell division control protein 45
MTSGRLPDDSAPDSPPDRSSTQPTNPKQPSARALRRRLVKLRRKYKSVLQSYYELGSSYSEPISSLMYSLASALGKEENDLLWYAIVGIGSLELYGRDITGVGISYRGNGAGGLAGWGGERGSHIRQLLRDEVSRLNPPKLSDPQRDATRGEAHGVIPTTARSPTDTSIRLSPEPKFLLIRHWSLYDSMLHSPYLASRLHIWSDAGRKRLHKLLAKMGVSLTQCKQSYAHMDMDLKRGLRERLLKYAPLYGLDDLVPPVTRTGVGKEGWGFVRSWGWKACLSANDAAVIIGAVLEVGTNGVLYPENGKQGMDRRETEDEDGVVEGESFVARFWEAYDALGKYEYFVENTFYDDTYGEHSVDALKAALPTAIHLHRAILRTGTSLIEKGQIRHLRAFRMAVVREGPDVSLFTHPSALTKLALWLGEAIAEQERGQKGKLSKGGRGTPLVVAGLNAPRGVYVIVGTGGGGRATDLQNKKEEKRKREEKLKARELRRAEKEKRRQERIENMGDEGAEEEEEESGTDSSDDDELDDIETEARGYGKNRFGNAFQAVLAETGAKVRIDSFDHCVAEVKKEDLSGFLESLSMKAVIG